MKTLNIYLGFNGNCEAAFDYYKSIFGGEFNYVGRFKDIPAQEGMPPLSDEMKEKIMHISLTIKENIVIMGSDTGDWAPEVVFGDNFSISIGTDTQEEADHLFNQLNAGGVITMPIGMTFWGDYFGMCTDKFGINWMVSFDTTKA